MAKTYLDLHVTYAVHAKSLWHDAEHGGYWGGGIDEENQNGAVRGMCNTMVTYAALVHAGDLAWLTEDQNERLHSAGLARSELLRHIRANLTHITAHHSSATSAAKPVWGQSWQSPLWLGAAGMAVLLVWNDLGTTEREAISGVAAAEADRVAAKPPGDYVPGNTRAEENGWDMHAMAAALAVVPDHPHASKWMSALKSYAANTYSIPADRSSTCSVGSDRVRDIVRTTNLFSDFTLDNHGFFHPDYVQVSGQHLGEAWLLLALGDRIHGTQLAGEFEPYSLHHVRDVWEGVMRPLLLPSGEFAFPAGNDWTFHCSMNQAYLAWVSTSVRDPLASVAEESAILGVLDRRAVSPPGRVLGDSPIEWWWEPLLCKRNSAAMLLHELRPEGGKPSEGERRALADGAWCRLFPDARIWIVRNRHYFASVNWAKSPMATFVPCDGNVEASRYMCIPLPGSILPQGKVTEFELIEQTPPRALLRYEDGNYAVVCAMKQCLVCIASKPFASLGVENDKLSGGRRRVVSGEGTNSVVALRTASTFKVGGTWLNIDNFLGMAASEQGFAYEPAGGYNHRSVGVDRVTPALSARCWAMVAGADASATQRMELSFREQGPRKHVCEFRDADGLEWEISISSRTKGAEAVQVKRVSD